MVEVSGAHLERAISYQLTIRVSRAAWVEVGRLGRYRFPKGRFIYTGSARRGVSARVERHLRKSKKAHWHLDYLLAHRYCRIEKAVASDRPECELNAETAGIVLVPGFGSSDCRRRCTSHLKYLGP